MYLKYDDFLPLAPTNVGKIRVNHVSSSCSGGRDSMVVERKTDGSVSAFCFRCGLSGYKPDSSINPYKHRKVEEIEKSNKILHLPNDLMFINEDSPVDVIMYLHNVGMYDEPKPMVIKYSPIANRVYFIFNADNWLARSMEKNNQRKWIQNIPDRYNHNLFIGSSSPLDQPLVIVEDLISSLVLEAKGVNAYCLYGSAFTARDRLAIMKIAPSNVLVWMDNDNAKIKKQQADIAFQLNQLNIPSNIIKSLQDPKAYHDYDIPDHVFKYDVETVSKVLLKHPSAGTPVSLLSSNSIRTYAVPSPYTEIPNKELFIRTPPISLDDALAETPTPCP